MRTDNLIKTVSRISGIAAALMLATLMVSTVAMARPMRGRFGMQNLHGNYTTAGHAFDASTTGTDSEPVPPAVTFAAAGFLSFDGKGNVTSGEETINYGSPGTGDSFTCELAGGYTVDSTTGRVILTLTSTAGPAVTAAESDSSNSAQCGGTATWVGYLDSPAGKRLSAVEQTVTGGTPTPPAFSTTPIISAQVWTKQNN